MTQGEVQASVRAVTGTTNDWNGDWHALFTLAGIPDGDWDGRMIQWINLKLGTAYTDIWSAQQAFALSVGAYNWSSIGTFDASVGPPLVTGSRISLLADSVGQLQMAMPAANQAVYNESGWLNQVYANNPRFNMDSWADASVTLGGRGFKGSNCGLTSNALFFQSASLPGYGADNNAAGLWLTEAAIRDADICIIQMTQNNMSQANDPAFYGHLMDLIIATGRKPVLATFVAILTGGSRDTNTFKDNMIAIRDATVIIAAAKGVPVIDLMAIVGNPVGTVRATFQTMPANWFLADGLHPSLYAAYVYGVAGGAGAITPNATSSASTVINTLVQSGSPLTALRATNIMSAARSTFNSGNSSANAGQFTGTKDTGLTISGLTNSTCVCSKVANPTTGGNSQRMVVTPVGALTYESFTIQAPNISASLASQWVVCWALVTMDAWPYVSQNQLSMLEAPTTTIRGTAMSVVGSGATTHYPAARQVLLQSPPVLFDSSATGLTTSPRWQVGHNPNAALAGSGGTGTIQIDEWGVSIVTDPRTAWHG